LRNPFVAAVLPLLLVHALSYAPHAGADEARWRSTSDNGCLVWDALPQSDETVTWSGSCVGGKASGHGTEVFRYRVDGVWKEERYVGEMQGGRLHGRGTLIYDTGDRYEGDFVDGKRIGRGTYTHANGDRYQGDYKDDRRTGNGVFAYHSGGTYEGDFVNGTFSGHGTFTFANGDRYEGEFRGGMPNGHGTFKASNGDVVTGNWSNGCFREGVRVAAVGTTKEKCGFK
jgi:hypothetical protein